MVEALWLTIAKGVFVGSLASSLIVLGVVLLIVRGWLKNIF